MSDVMIDTPAGGSEVGFAPPGAEDFKAPTETVKPETLSEKSIDETTDSVVADDSTIATEETTIGSKDEIDPLPSSTPTASVDVTSSEPKKIEEIKRDVKIEITSAKEMIRQMLTHDRKLAHEKDFTVSLIVTDDDIQKASLTSKQIELIEIYVKQTSGDPTKLSEIPSDEYILELIDTVREQIANEALEKGLLSGKHLLPLVDKTTSPDLYSRLEQTAFIDDPNLISEVFASVKPEELDKIQVFLQEKARLYSSDSRLSAQLTEIQELIKLTPKIKEIIAKIPETANLKQLFIDIANGKKPEIVKYVSEFSQEPEGALEILKVLFAESGIDFDPNFFKKHGKTIGKFSLLAAIGLMYALMKSGKEQPQGYQ